MVRICQGPISFSEVCNIGAPIFSTRSMSRASIWGGGGIRAVVLNPEGRWGKAMEERILAGRTPFGRSDRGHRSRHGAVPLFGLHR